MRWGMVDASMMDCVHASTLSLSSGTTKVIDYLLEVMRKPDERNGTGLVG